MKKPVLEHSTHPPGILTSADVLAGAVIPVRVRLSVTVRPPDPDAAQNATSVDAQLARHAPQLLAWAQQSPENARLLLTDPLEAAGRAKLKLSDAERRALAAQYHGPAKLALLDAVRSWTSCASPSASTRQE